LTTQSRLHELLRYNTETGIFVWIARTSNRIKIGDIAGTLSKRDGYVRISVDGIIYLAHRLMWLYMTGKFPTSEVDHKNTVRNDNRWENLREATRLINVQNQRRARKDNCTGFLGVRKMKGNFQANIRVNGRSLNCGTFPTPELAHEAYLTAKRALHDGCTL